MTKERRFTPGSGGEKAVDQHFLELFRDLIHSRFGIYIQPEKDYLLRSKLSRLLDKTDCPNLGTFYKRLQEENPESTRALIRYITTTHTFFFREQDHLQVLSRDILEKKLSYPVIWCAASSSGEEVYSICLELLDRGIESFLIIASDLNAHVLRHMKKAVYAADRVVPVGRRRIKRYFEPYVAGPDSFYRLKEEVRQHVLVKQINLVKPVRFERTFDYIFCRNALIYFDKATQGFVVRNLLDNLDPEGYLFVGHSETLVNLSVEVTAVAPSVYCRRQGRQRQV